MNYEKIGLFVKILEFSLIASPVIMIIMTQIMTISMGSIEEKDINIAFEKNPSKELVSLIENQTDKNTETS